MLIILLLPVAGPSFSLRGQLQQRTSSDSTFFLPRSDAFQHWAYDDVHRVYVQLRRLSIQSHHPRSHFYYSPQSCSHCDYSPQSHNYSIITP